MRIPCLQLTFQLGSETLCKLLEAEHDDPSKITLLTMVKRWRLQSPRTEISVR